MIYDNIEDSYKTILSFHRTEFKVKDSKFIVSAYPIDKKEEAEKFIKSVRHEFFNAHHHPYAYVVGCDRNIYKISDDGEPSGSSGKSILRAIDKYNLTNIIIIATRYFGGTKLGKSGLSHAYFKSVDLCLAECNIVEKFVGKEIYLEFEYYYLNPVMNFLNNKKIRIIDNHSDELVKINLMVRLSLIETIKKELRNITKGKIKILTV
ncbi:MAG: IMPACT family protein [Ignavibacteria bacterium]|nr:IMPACT family protein [Ignavibacteria bacterium]